MANLFRCMLNVYAAPSPYYTIYIQMNTTNTININERCILGQNNRLAIN